MIDEKKKKIDSKPDAETSNNQDDNLLLDDVCDRDFLDPTDEEIELEMDMVDILKNIDEE